MDRSAETKLHLVRLTNHIVKVVKERLGHIILSSYDKDNKYVTIRLASDTVYEPSQAGWEMGKGTSYNSSANFLAICGHREENADRLEFRLKRSQFLMDGERRYGYEIVAVESTKSLGSSERKLAVKVEGKSVARDFFTNYVFLTEKCPEEEETFSWRIIPRGNHQFQILYCRKNIRHEKEDDVDNRHNSHFNSEKERSLESVEDLAARIQPRVRDGRFMGLSAHRFWKFDVENGDNFYPSTKVMVSLQNEFSASWEIKTVKFLGHTQRPIK